MSNTIPGPNPIPSTMRTGVLLSSLVRHQREYPQDIPSQQRHFGMLPSIHEEFEQHLEQTYDRGELEQLLESVQDVLGIER